MDSAIALDIQNPPAASRRSRGWIVLAILVSLLVLGEIAYQSLQRMGWTTYTSTNSGLVDGRVYAISTDDQGRVWVATSEGLSVLSPDGSWMTYTSDNSGLADNDVSAVAIDEQGRVWAVTFQGDLSVLSPDGSWTMYTSTNSCLADGTVSAVTTDDHGRVWVGASGLCLLSPDGNWTTYTTDNSGLADNDVSAVVTDEQGRVWAVIFFGGLSVLSPDGGWTSYTSTNSGLASDDVSDVAIDGQGRVWAGADRDLSMMDPDGSWTTYRRTNPDHQWVGTVRALAIDDQDRVWVGASDGLSVLSPDGNWTIYTAANSGFADFGVSDVAFDGQGRVWISTLSSGLSMFDTKRDLPFIRPVIQVWPVLRAAWMLVVIVLGVIWMVQRRRSRPKKAVSPQPVTHPELGEVIPPEPSPAITALSQQAPSEAEAMDDIELF